MTSFLDKSIGELEIANPLAGSEQFPVTQTGDTRRTALTDILSYVVSAITTDDVLEGANLYFTEARADARVALHAALTNNPHNVTLAQLGIEDVTNIKHNWTAGANPLAGDDVDDGYTVGSLWFRGDVPRLWICLSATASAANWQVIAFTKSDVGLGNVQNINITTWAGGTNITTVNQTAVTDREGAINHNNLLNYVANKHVDHSSVTVSTPATGGLTGGSNLAASFSLGLDFSGMNLIGSLEGTADKIPVWDNSGAVVGYTTPNAIASASAFNQILITSGSLSVDSTKRGALYELTADSTLTFDSVSTLGTGFFIAIKSTSTGVITLTPTLGDTVEGLTSFKIGPGNGCLIFSDGGTKLICVGQKPEIIILKDIKAQNADGGTFTSGAWRKRDIQEIADNAGLCSVASNVITLQPGRYEVNLECPAEDVNFHQARLQNTSDTATLLEGSVAQSNNGNHNSVVSRIIGEFTITAAKTIEIQHQCSTTGTTTGFGASANFTNEVYTQGWLKRLGGI